MSVFGAERIRLADSHASLLRWGLGLLFAGLVCVAAAWLAPSVSLDVRLAYVCAFTVVAGELVVSAYLAPRLSPPRLLLLALPAVAALAALRAQPVEPWSAALLTIALLWAATALGAAVGARIDHPGHVLAVVAISSVADLWSVYDASGPSARLAAHAAEHPEHLIVLALPWAMLGTARIEAIIGAGDVVFAALYLAAFARHGLLVRRAAAWMLGGLLAGLCALLALERAVPLLPFIGGAVLLADRRTLALEGRDRRSVAVVLLLLGGLVIYRFAR